MQNSLDSLIYFLTLKMSSKRLKYKYVFGPSLRSISINSKSKFCKVINLILAPFNEKLGHYSFYRRLFVLENWIMNLSIKKAFCQVQKVSRLIVRLSTYLTDAPCIFPIQAKTPLFHKGETYWISKEKLNPPRNEAKIDWVSCNWHSNLCIMIYSAT